MYGPVGISGAPREKIAGNIDHECTLAGIEAVREEIEFTTEWLKYRKISTFKYKWKKDTQVIFITCFGLLLLSPF